MGLSTLYTVGWAAKPFYDEKKKYYIGHWICAVKEWKSIH